MIVTDNEDWAARARYLTTQAKDDPVESIHNAIGYNYRLTNIQAAMGCAQMEKLDEYIAVKLRIARLYAESFFAISGITCMPEASWATSIFWIYTILVDEGDYGVGSRALMKSLNASKIEVRPLWQPLHQSPVYRGSYALGGDVAERIAATALCLPSSVGLKPSDQYRVISQIAGLGQES